MPIKKRASAKRRSKSHVKRRSIKRKTSHKKRTSAKRKSTYKKRSVKRSQKGGAKVKGKGMDIDCPPGKKYYKSLDKCLKQADYKKELAAMKKAKNVIKKTNKSIDDLTKLLGKIDIHADKDMDKLVKDFAKKAKIVKKKSVSKK